MPISRASAAAMEDTILQICTDGCVTRLRRSWELGRPGSLDDIYSLAVLRGEAVLRECEVDGPRSGVQLTLDQV